MANTPTAQATRFTINNIECGIWINPIFANEVGIKVTYKSGNDWTWLVEPSIFLSEITTKEKTDATFKAALEEINTAIEKNLFKKVGGDEPQNGKDRLQFLISNLVVTDNKLG